MVSKFKTQGDVVALKPNNDTLLPSNLEYSVEQVDLDEFRGDLIPICKFRIPEWVEFKWTGDWSKTSSKWTPAKKKELKVDDDQKSIWMSWRDI